MQQTKPQKQINNINFVRTESAPPDNSQFMQTQKKKIQAEKKINVNATAFDYSSHNINNTNTTIFQDLPKIVGSNSTQQQTQAPINNISQQSDLPKLSKPKKQMKLNSMSFNPNAPSFQPTKQAPTTFQPQTIQQTFQPSNNIQMTNQNFQQATNQKQQFGQQPKQQFYNNNNNQFNKQVQPQQQQQKQTPIIQQGKGPDLLHAQKPKLFEQLELHGNEEEKSKQKEEEEKKKQQEEEEKQKKIKEQEQLKKQEELKKQQEEQEELKRKQEEEKQKQQLNILEVIQKAMENEKGTDLIKEHLQISNYTEREFEKFEQPVYMKKQYSKPQYQKPQHQNYNQDQNQNQNQGSSLKRQDFRPGTKKPNKQYQNQEPSFKRKQEDAGVIQKMGQIEQSKKWLEENMKANLDENIRIQKEIKFETQTLSPDNLEQKLEKLQKFDKSDFGRQELITQLIEKACTSSKYVTTYAQLIYKIIKHENCAVSEDGKGIFRGQLISRIQGQFLKREVLEKKKLYKEMDEAELEKYLKKKKEKLKQLTTFIGELHKVKVLPIKLIKSVCGIIINNFINTYMYQFSNDRGQYKILVDGVETSLDSQDKEDKFVYSNDHIEAFINFLEIVGEELEKKEEKSNEVDITKEQTDLLKNIQEDILSKDPSFKYQKYTFSVNQLNIGSYFQLLDFVRESKIFDARIGALIQNLKQAKQNGWHLGIKKQDASARSLADVQREHLQKLKESDQNSKDYYNQLDDKKKSGGRGNNKQQYKEQPAQYRKKANKEEQQKSSEDKKEEQLKLIESFDQRKEQPKYKDIEKNIKMSIAAADENKSQQLIQQLASQEAGIDIIFILFKDSFDSKADNYEKKSLYISKMVVDFVQSLKGDSCLYEILDKVINDTLGESSDFPFIYKSYAIIIDQLRYNGLLELNKLKITSTDDEDDDEEIIDFLNSVIEELLKLTNQKSTYDKQLKEIKEFYQKLELKCNFEGQLDVVIEKVKKQEE